MFQFTKRQLFAGATSAPKRPKLIDSDEENEPQEFEQANAEPNKTIVDGESSDEGVNKDDNNVNIGYAYIFCVIYENSSNNFENFLYFRNDFVNDFEAMLSKKREDGTKRRKRRDIDIINDNDDIIDQLIQNMRHAAEVIYVFI